MLPEFDNKGNLPVGIHKTKWPEFIERYSHNHYRKRLIKEMSSAFKNLKKAGCTTVFTDGSFVTDKQKPNDYDGCLDVIGVDTCSLDFSLKDCQSKRIAQKIKFYEEIFPATMCSKHGQTALIFFKKAEIAAQKELSRLI